MRSIIFAIVLVSLLAATAQAALTQSTIDILKWYDSFALVGIWKKMVYYSFYKFIADYVCANQSKAVIDQVSSLFSKADVETNMPDTATACKAGFDLMYNAVWYTGEQTLVFGNYDQYNYTP